MSYSGLVSIIAVVCTIACAMALLLVGCGSQTAASTSGTMGSSTLAVPTSTSAVPTTLVPTTVVTLATTTTTTPGSVTTRRAALAKTDHELLVAATKRELRDTGNEALYDAEVSKVDVFGTWAVTSADPPPGYEPGFALFHNVDGSWKAVEGLSHQFIQASLVDDGVPKDIIDAIIGAGYPVAPE